MFYKDKPSRVDASARDSIEQQRLQIAPAIQHCHDQNLPAFNPVNDTPRRADKFPVVRDSGMQQLGHDAAAIGQGNQERGFGFQLVQDRQRIIDTVLSDVFDDLGQILPCRMCPQHLI